LKPFPSSSKATVDSYSKIPYINFNTQTGLKYKALQWVFQNGIAGGFLTTKSVPFFAWSTHLELKHYSAKINKCCQKCKVNDIIKTFSDLALI